MLLISMNLILVLQQTFKLTTEAILAQIEEW